METLQLRKADVKEILARTFPDYHGRKFRLRFSDHVILSDLNWSGGSRNEYAFVRIDGAVKSLDFSTIAPWNHNAEGQRIDLPPHVLCVKHQDFCGKDLGVVIIVNPNDIDALPQPIRALLPAPK